MLRLESCPLAANNRLARVSVLSDGIDSGGFTAIMPVTQQSLRSQIKLLHTTSAQLMI